MRVEQIFEARSNSNLNPRLSVNSIISRYANQPDVFVHFSSTRKLGINPKMDWRTPMGVYSYPIKHIARRTFDFIDNVGGAMEFASEKPYVFVFRYRSNKTLNLQSHTNFNRDLEKMSDYLVNRFPDMKHIIKQKESIAALDKSGRSFWYGMYEMIDAINVKPSILARVILHDVLGYELVLDLGGGIIHRNEKTQALHLALRKFDVIELIDNTQKLPHNEKQARTDLSSSPLDAPLKRAINEMTGGGGYFDNISTLRYSATQYSDAARSLNDFPSQMTIEKYVDSIGRFYQEVEKIGKTLYEYSGKLEKLLTLLLSEGEMDFFRGIEGVSVHIHKSLKNYAQTNPAIRNFNLYVNNLITAIEDDIFNHEFLFGEDHVADNFSDVVDVFKKERNTIVRNMSNEMGVL